MTEYFAGLKKRIVPLLAWAAIDAVLSALAVICALCLRLEIGGHSYGIWMNSLWTSIPFSIVFTLFALALSGTYNVRWEYAGIREYFFVALSITGASIVSIIAFEALGVKLPRSQYILYIFFGFLFIGGARVIFAYSRQHKKRAANLKRTMIVGAGKAGAMVLRELKTSAHSENLAVCFIDDNPQLIGTTIDGVKVVGNDGTICENAEKYKIDEILVAIPSLTDEQRARIFEAVAGTGKSVKVLPSLTQFVNEQAALGQLRAIEIEDLLPRKTVKTDKSGARKMLEGKTVMVTGGGGSIGSELCRQIAELSPKKLIIFDIYENNAYDISQELKRKYGDTLDLETLIGSVRDPVRLDGVFGEYRPDFVFHAAAHKHVPLMEDSPREAIKNNVMGTYNVASACVKYGVKRMLLVSTDKAVNPTNVMGASKRMCEMVVQMMNRRSTSTDFVAVRFGNVLGSNGSVIPLFKKQIEAGGPVTVTDRNIIRYFMTIPEAVSLILDAGTYAKGGEIFVLDMGEPVRIDDLARKMIRLSGHTPDVDIKVEYTGLRPGEKLYEELLMSEEGLTKTENNLIYIGKPIAFDDTVFESQLENIKKAAYENDGDIRPLIKEIVTTYHY